MKNISFMFMVGIMMLTTFVSCNKDDSKYHSIQLYRPWGGVGYIYADQTVDTVAFTTTENFSFASDASWIKVDPEKSKGTVKEGFMLTTYFPITIEPNTTGKVRTGVINGKMYSDDFNRDLNLLFQQLACHNIVRPIPVEISNMGIEFLAKDSAHWTKDSIRFTAYCDWKLETTDGSYLTPRVASGKPGRHTVILDLTPNTTTEKKEATLFLKSTNGVTTEMKYTQLPKKD